MVVTFYSHQLVEWWEKKEELPSVAGFVRLRKLRMGGHVIVM